MQSRRPRPLVHPALVPVLVRKKQWRLEHLGSKGELQPVGREREAELPGDHATSVDSSGRHIMVEGTESESLARLAATEADDAGRKLVYSSARMVVRLEPTPAYKPPVSDASVRVEDGAPEGVVVAHHDIVPRYLSWGYAMGSDDHTKGGHTVLSHRLHRPRRGLYPVAT